MSNNKSDFDLGYEAGLRRALEAAATARGQLIAEDDDRRGFQKACYERAGDLIVRYINHELSFVRGASK